MGRVGWMTRESVAHFFTSRLRSCSWVRASFADAFFLAFRFAALSFFDIHTS